MRKLDETSFNETLRLKLEKLQSLVDENITSENIQNFPEALIRRIKKAIEYQYQFDDTGSINGIGMYKINNMVRYLKSNMMSYIICSFVKQTSVSGSEGYDRAEFEVPEGYDGRNSIIITKSYQKKTTYESTKQKGRVMMRKWITKRKKSILLETVGLTGVRLEYFVLLWRKR